MHGINGVWGVNVLYKMSHTHTHIDSISFNREDIMLE